MNKERHGCLTAFLVVIMLGNALSIIFSLIGNEYATLLGGSVEQPYLFIFINVLAITSAILILNWKIVGVYGLIGAYLIGLISNFIITNNMGGLFGSTVKWAGLLGSVIWILIFLTVLTKKKDGYSAWNYFRGNYSINKESKINKRCCQCGIIYSGSLICPKCNSSLFEETKQNVSESQTIEIIAKNNSDVEKKKCKKCGEKVEEDIFKCPRCKGDEFI
jgi:RNA polymerase subunit RPABC4/transcription elongation factor Spt4